MVPQKIKRPLTMTYTQTQTQTQPQTQTPPHDQTWLLPRRSPQNQRADRFAYKSLNQNDLTKFIM